MLENEYAYQRAITMLAVHQMMQLPRQKAKPFRRFRSFWSLGRVLLHGLHEVASVALAWLEEEPVATADSVSEAEPVIVDGEFRHIF
jgi:hypothetical protein